MERHEPLVRYWFPFLSPWHHKPGYFPVLINECLVEAADIPQAVHPTRSVIV